MAKDSNKCHSILSPVSLWCALGLIVIVIALPGPVWAQKEVTSSIYGSRTRETKSRYYGEFEKRSRTHMPIVEGRTPRRAFITMAPTAERVRSRNLLADSHAGLKFYNRRTCIKCHPQQDRSLHTIRAGITCRQCHGEEPIAGIRHYYSLMNPIRRYAVVCAKCHKGASKSFATYLVHEPNPVAMGTQRAFPLLFYTVWFMIAVTVGTFASFLPHAFLWGLREFLPTGRKHDDKD